MLPSASVTLRENLHSRIVMALILQNYLFITVIVLPMSIRARTGTFLKCISMYNN